MIYTRDQHAGIVSLLPHASAELGAAGRGKLTRLLRGARGSFIPAALSITAQHSACRHRCPPCLSHPTHHFATMEGDHQGSTPMFAIFLLT